MSATFADNVGPDNTLVYSGPVSFNTVACAGPAVCPFDLSILFTTPFLYNPSQGRLLLDFKLTGFASTQGTFDAVAFNPPGGGSVASVNGGLNDATGGFDFSGDIVQLRYTAVAPEPASCALMLTGVASLAWMRRRRNTSGLR